MWSSQKQPIAPRANSSWCVPQGAAALPGAAWRRAYHAIRTDPRLSCRDGPENISAMTAATGGILRLFLDVVLGTVVAGGGLHVPLAIGGLVFDRLGSAGYPLFGGDALGGGECRGMGRKRLREYAVDGVGPAAVMLNDPVGDMAHGELAFCWCVQGVNLPLIL